MTGSGQSDIRLFDLLERPFQSTGDIERAGREISCLRPWALLRFGDVPLKQGWWRLVCETDAPTHGIEIRLRSSSDPLIVIPAVGRHDVRLYLRSSRPYDLSLLVSAWPGTFAFSALRLVRLNFAEEARLLVVGAIKTLSRDQPLKRLARVAQRLFAGQSFGVRTGNEPVLPEPPSQPADLGSPDPLAPRRAVVRGNIIAVLETDCTLHPKAFQIAEITFARSPDLLALYSDSCEGGEVVVRTGWDSLLATRGAFDDAPIFIRKSEKVGNLKMPPSLLDISADHGDASIGRVALPLATRDKPRRMLPRLEPIPILAVSPLVSVIVPTKIRIDLLEKCLVSLATKTGYSALEVVIVDNGSTDPRLNEILDQLSAQLSISRIFDNGAFNFSRLINAGVKKSVGEIVLILNDDIEATEEGWLHRMVASVVDPATGVVGARLVYPDGSIQHAGVTMGLGGPCGHLWKGLPPFQAERNFHVRLPGKRMAVTGACMAFRRSVFDAVQGFDEAFAVAFNDIDFCLRIRQIGLETVYRGDAVLTHHESQSRGFDDINVARRRRLASETQKFLERWSSLVENDPYGSPAFDVTLERGVGHQVVASFCKQE